MWVNNDLISSGYPRVTITSDRAPHLSRASLSVVEALKGACFNEEDLQDSILEGAGMSAAGRAWGMMPQCYVEKIDKCRFRTLPPHFIFFYEELSLMRTLVI